VKAVLAAATSYALLFLLLLWQALRGQSITAPDATALGALMTWALASLLVASWLSLRARASSRTGLERTA